VRNIGRVLKSQGNKGELKTELYPSFPETPFFFQGISEG